MMMFNLFTIIGFKMINKFISVFTSLCLVSLIIMGSLLYNSYDKNYFAKYQREHRLDKEAKIRQEELDQVTSDLLDYLKYGENSFLENHFNEKEILHMEDVFKLYEGGRKIMLIIFLLSIGLFVLGFKNSPSLFMKNMSVYFIITAIAIGIILSVLMVNFSDAFIKFHHIFFDNDLWLLNPETDLMIRILPEHFFESLVIRIITMAVSLVVIIEIILFGINKEVINGTTSR